MPISDEPSPNPLWNPPQGQEPDPLPRGPGPKPRLVLGPPPPPKHRRGAGPAPPRDERDIDPSGTEVRIRVDLARASDELAAQSPTLVSRARDLAPFLKKRVDQVSRAAARRIDQPARERLLIALQAWPCMATAAESAGLAVASIYKAMKVEPDFAQAIQDAMAAGFPQLEQRAITRAFRGHKRPIFQGGRLVGYERVFSDRLAEIILKRRDRQYRERVEVSGEVLNRHEIGLSPDLAALIASVTGAGGPKRVEGPVTLEPLQAPGSPAGMVDAALAAMAVGKPERDADTQGDVSAPSQSEVTESEQG